MTMDGYKKSTWLAGAAAGLLFSAPLMAAFYAGDRILSLPFMPYDLFDWLARVLPGDIIAKTIETMVSVIRTLNLGETSSTAKMIEHLLALGLFVMISVVFGAILFEIFKRVHSAAHFNIALIAGIILGVGMALISIDVNFTASVDPTLGFGWVVLVYAVFGVSFQWLYLRLSEMTPTASEADKANMAPAGDLDRREFLIRVGGATAAITVVGAGLGMLLQRRAAIEIVQINPELTPEALANLPRNLPNAKAAVIPAPGTRLEYTPLEDHYRIDISLRPPNIFEAAWALDLSGMMEQPLLVTLAELRDNFEPVDQYITLSCISNPVGGDLIGTTRWTGIPLKTLLEAWKVDPDATHARIDSEDGFYEYLELDTARMDERVMLCYAWDGKPLTTDHGFPLRVYIPDRYGMKQPKWITHIAFTHQDEEGYWVRRGWSESAKVRTTSVVDTVSAEHAYTMESMTYVPIGGIAYSGAKGISKVEVRIDDGEWQEAELREPISELTWVIWRYDWAFEPGEHRFWVRAYDGDGSPQLERREDTRPDGAAGYHSKRANIQTEA